MEHIKATVQLDDTPQVQSVLSQLNAYDDLLLLSGQIKSDAVIEVNYLTAEGDVISLGSLPDEALMQIEDLYGCDVRIDIADFGVYKRADGTLRLWVDLEAEREYKKGGFNLPLIIGVGAATGMLTLLVVAVKIILYRKKNR